jgi:hypothetical protein
MPAIFRAAGRLHTSALRAGGNRRLLSTRSQRARRHWGAGGVSVEPRIATLFNDQPPPVFPADSLEEYLSFPDQGRTPDEWLRFDCERPSA